jgi:hypothetical protein
MAPTSTTWIPRRLSFRLTISHTWNPNIFGRAASRTTTRGSERWMLRIASTPSFTTRVSSPRAANASATRRPSSTSGCAISTGPSSSFVFAGSTVGTKACDSGATVDRSGAGWGIASGGGVGAARTAGV